MNKVDLIKHSVDLCEILQFEFVFHKPCQTLDYVLDSNFMDMQGIFTLHSLQNVSFFNIIFSIYVIIKLFQTRFSMEDNFDYDVGETSAPCIYQVKLKLNSDL